MNTFEDIHSENKVEGSLDGFLPKIESPYVDVVTRSAAVARTFAAYRRNVSRQNPLAPMCKHQRKYADAATQLQSISPRMPGEGLDRIQCAFVSLSRGTFLEIPNIVS
jgi:hypothetical protein